MTYFARERRKHRVSSHLPQVPAMKAACKALAVLFRDSSMARGEYAAHNPQKNFTWHKVSGQVREVRTHRQAYALLVQTAPRL